MSAKSTGVRWLMAVGSVTGFLGGWVLLAHAPKPVPEAVTPPADVGSAPTFLAPRGLQPFSRLPNGFTFPEPRLRTRGS
ncbi:MAG TPA: hypothetical protein VK449_06425 [Anaerolineales bacterium]|nr:hypothetical protein [Anaerolineales bacterium]